MRGKYVRRGVQVRGGLAAHPAQLVPQRDGPVMTRRYWQAHITCSRALMLYQCDVRFRCVRQTCEQRALLTHQPISPPSSSHQPSSHHPIIPSSHHPIIPSAHQPINPPPIYLQGEMRRQHDEHDKTHMHASSSSSSAAPH